MPMTTNSFHFKNEVVKMWKCLYLGESRAVHRIRTQAFYTMLSTELLLPPCRDLQFWNKNTHDTVNSKYKPILCSTDSLVLLSL